MGTDRRLLFECIVAECDHLLQIWVEGDELHAHVECDRCQELALEAVRKVYGELPVTVVP